MSEDPRLHELVTTFCKLVYLAGQIGCPDVPEPKISLYGRQDAAKFLSVSVSTFDRCKAAKWIEPHLTLGTKNHRYAESDLVALRERLSKESPPNGV